jgi:hypothetical protein
MLLKKAAYSHYYAAHTIFSLIIALSSLNNYKYLYFQAQSCPQRGS